jgi:hypothetical protein
LFFYAECVFKAMKSGTNKVELITLDLWIGRLAFLHNEILYTPVKECQLQCMETYTRFLSVAK